MKNRVCALQEPPPRPLRLVPSTPARTLTSYTAVRPGPHRPVYVSSLARVGREHRSKRCASMHVCRLAFMHLHLCAPAVRLTSGKKRKSAGSVFKSAMCAPTEVGLMRQHVQFPPWNDGGNRLGSCETFSPPGPAASDIPSCASSPAVRPRSCAGGYWSAVLPACVARPRPLSSAQGESPHSSRKAIAKGVLSVRWTLA